MLIGRPNDIPSSEITPESVYLNRRAFMGKAGTLALAALSLPAVLPALPQPAQSEELTSEEDATSYNNYYEFGTDKSDPKEEARGFVTHPWSVNVEGMVKNAKRFAIEDLLKGFTPQDRVYRHRCVEGWSMVIPWRGIPLRDVLARLEPLPGARFVELTTTFDPNHIPGQRGDVLPWPYKEALRLDEAMHPLTLLVTGMYGKDLPPQNGAPLRTVIPWKYGFKGTKAIVRIRFTDKQPRTTWNDVRADEYGFYANVNPAVDHPRWSQAKERRIGKFLRIATLPFNGYADQVASMYAGMDLRKNF